MIEAGPLIIGDLTIDPPLVLAPMAGVSDAPFRIIVKRYGCGLVYGEMVSAQALLYGATARSEELLRHTPEEHPLVMQLFGSQAEALALAAQRVRAAGADMVDINCGCPVPKVVKTGAGAALLRQPLALAGLLNRVRRAVDGPLSIKIRKGWNQAEVNAVDIARLAVAEGIDCITVHGRTRCQSYQGVADWEIIAQVKQAVPVPVIGNGDVTSPQAAQRMLRETGCDGVMIGRAALGNPWIFQETGYYLRTGELLPPPTPQERMRVLREHMALMVQHKGAHLALLHMRKHAAWYVREQPGSARIRAQLVRATSLEEMDTILVSWLSGG